MLESVLAHLKNWFVVDVHERTFTVENNVMELPFLRTGQYYRICGSVCNDGLHKYGDSDLIDETFTGAVWALAVPKAVIDLAADIEAWQEKNGEASRSPYASESFGGYSYSKATDSATGGPVTWQAAFRGQLAPWRKAREVGPMKPLQPWRWSRVPY